MKAKRMATVIPLASALLSGAAGAANEANRAALPPEQHQAGIAFLTGGVGKDEAKAFERAAPRFPLALEFIDRVGKREEFLAGIAVKVIDRDGKTLLSTTSDGPFLLAKIPSGRYTVSATYD